MMTATIISPQDWTLCAVSISVVFACLLILWGVYSLSSAIFTGRLGRRKGKDADEDADIAAAIALAISMETESERGSEDNVLTFSPSERIWSDRKMLFRKKPGNERI